MTAHIKHLATCSCGAVHLELQGAPLAAPVCHCDDCQRGSAALEALTPGQQVRDAWGGTPYVVYRKDRCVVTKGQDLLRATKNRPDSPTSRNYASCCGAPMFVSFDIPLHWTPVYRDRLGNGAPPIEWRVMTRFADPARPIPEDVPAFKSLPMRYAFRLIGAKLAMLLGR